MLDLDVEALALKVDRQHAATKKVILDHVMEIKAKMMAAQTQAIEEEKRRAASVIAAKQAEIDLLRFELHQSNSRVGYQGEVISRVAGAYDLTKDRKRSMALMIQAFYCWRQYAVTSRARKGRLARALHWYKTEHLQRHVLRAWARVAGADHKVTLANRYRSALDAARAEIGTQWAGEVEALRRQLADAHAALAREAEAREKLEENMKQAFMRGVCALNIEAMSVMKRGAPPGGANPVPITLPASPPQPAPVPPAPAPSTAPLSAMSGPGPVSYGAPLTPPPPLPAATPSHSQVPMQAQMQAPVMGGYGGIGMGAGLGHSTPGHRQEGGAAGLALSGTVPAVGVGGSVATSGAAAFYQRPRVMVERGPAGVAGAVPQPRPNAPLPTVRR